MRNATHPSSALVVFVALLVAPAAVRAQQTCSARCPDGSMSEQYVCDDPNYVPECLRGGAGRNAGNGGYVSPLAKVVSLSLAFGVAGGLGGSFAPSPDTLSGALAGAGAGAGGFALIGLALNHEQISTPVATAIGAAGGGLLSASVAQFATQGAEPKAVALAGVGGAVLTGFVTYGLKALAGAQLDSRSFPVGFVATGRRLGVSVPW